MTEEERFNNYFISGTIVLKNKLSITDYDELKSKERDIVIKNLTLLYMDPISGNFDKEHLKEVHHFLFQDLYPFAGEFRDVNIQKVEGGDPFTSYQNIESYLEEILKYGNEKVKTIAYPMEYAYFLADFYNALIVNHPFREGNGRTIREFIREFVVAKNKDLPFDDVELDFTKMSRENLLLGAKNRLIYPSMLEMEFMKGLVPIEQKKESTF